MGDNFIKQIFEYHPPPPKKTGGMPIPVSKKEEVVVVAEEEESGNEEFAWTTNSITPQEEATRLINREKAKEGLKDKEGVEIDINHGVVWGYDLALNGNNENNPFPTPTEEELEASAKRIAKEKEDGDLKYTKNEILSQREEIVRYAKKFAKLVNLKLKNNRRFLFSKNFDPIIPVTDIESYLEAAFDITLYDAWDKLDKLKRNFHWYSLRTIDEVIRNDRAIGWFAELVANEHNRAKSDNLTQIQKSAQIKAEYDTLKSIKRFYTLR